MRFLRDNPWIAAVLLIVVVITGQQLAVWQTSTQMGEVRRLISRLLHHLDFCPGCG